jgi:hypothetical protein
MFAQLPGPALFFVVAQWLKHSASQCSRQRQTHTMYLQITSNHRAKYNRLAKKMANEFLRSSRVKLSIISLGLCIICISDASTSSLPSLLVYQRKFELFSPIKSVLVDFSGLQERQSRICDKSISNENRQIWPWLQYHQNYPLKSPGAPF